MMNLEVRATETLASVGWQIRELFRDVQDNEKAESTSWAKFTNEQQRFELWARNLGLNTGGHTSLDYRFRDAQLIFQHTLGLFKDLESILCQLKVVAERDEGNLASGQEDGHASDDSEEEEDISSYQDKPLFDILLESVAATIDKLYRLAFKVRNPSMRLGNSRALTYREVDESTGVNLIDRFMEVDQQNICDLFRGWNGSHTDDHYLIPRLAKANTRRRQQFRYWKKRRDALELLSLAALVDEETAVPARPELDEKEALIVPGMLPIVAPSQPSSATKLNVDNIRLDDDTSMSSTVSFFQASDSMGGDYVSLPSPPKSTLDAKDFECPYCFTICPRKLLKKKNWEAHLFRDLRPYVCTHKECKLPDQQYDSLNDWIHHETLCHLSTHGRRDQEDASSPSFTEGKVREEWPPKHGISRDCPFCLLQNASSFHIASHLQRVATFSLPRSIGSDVEEDSSRISGQAELTSRSQESEVSNLSLNSNKEDMIGSEEGPLATDHDVRPITLTAIKQQFDEVQENNHNVDSFLRGLKSSFESNDLTQGSLANHPLPERRPPSPLLGAYRGTYSSIAPLPSPYPVGHDHDTSDTRTRLRRRDGQKIYIADSQKGSVTPFDARSDAETLRDALMHHQNIDPKAFISVLPRLSHENVLELRHEYKTLVKLQGKGINLAKHIKAKLGSTAFGKVCYVTALGRWESEAFWANFYYQSNASRRELLIESLFGRTNDEIRVIKESFKDPRYNNNLEKCMKTELQADKFRTAVLLALEGNRQIEVDAIDVDLVQKDMAKLHTALSSRQGGETALIYTIVQRSDSHLREVLRTYEETYKANFAREMIAKSQNLVGETLAHILNGAINRPLRDALLLHHALRDGRLSEGRSDLLISRLVRLHWEPWHLVRVKLEFLKQYGKQLEDFIKEAHVVSGDESNLVEFCVELVRSSGSQSS